ncbi:MAG: aspartate--tRNA ligase [Eubacteriales bacterium]|nr:aspartate--tRNA ligase [Eubacteriales bacterium]
MEFEKIEHRRTGYCATFRADSIGKTVTVHGWVQRRRALGGLIFVDLRDRSGIIQVSFEETSDKALFDKAYTLRSEDCVSVTGVIRSRGENAIRKDLPTGEIEIVATELRILSKSETPPFEIVENSNVKEELRLKYRYLDLRRPDMQAPIMLRAKLCRLAREYYADNDFIEIETPNLIRSTPEGARDYLVPSRIHPGHFYALPQSPQLYKQLLMVAGFDRYMQIAKCFRDEDLRADRQPEFTQIDLEMSFVDVDDVIEANEGFIQKAFKEILGVDIKLPLPRMTYAEAMERFGSDKPDLRFGYELKNISDTVKDFGFKVFSDTVAGGGSVRAIVVEDSAATFGRRDIDSLTEFVKTYRAKGLAWIKMGETVSSSFLKFLSDGEKDALISALGLKDGDCAFIVADKDQVTFDALGALRCEIAKRLDKIPHDPAHPEDMYKLLWVTEFPLLEYSEEEQRYVAKHHPFTSPMFEDLDLLDTDPGKVRAKAYDIVINGMEAGGGSIRIYNSELQTKMFEILGFSEERANAQFGFLINAFKYGVPPHGGMAYGLDRLVMILSGRENIRDVIAFPKVQNASEIMTKSPGTVSEEQLKELSIAVTAVEKEEE